MESSDWVCIFEIFLSQVQMPEHSSLSLVFLALPIFNLSALCQLEEMNVVKIDPAWMAVLVFIDFEIEELAEIMVVDVCWGCIAGVSVLFLLWVRGGGGMVSSYCYPEEPTVSSRAAHCGWDRALVVFLYEGIPNPLAWGARGKELGVVEQTES